MERETHKKVKISFDGKRGRLRCASRRRERTQRQATKENRVSEGEGKLITVRLRRTHTNSGMIYW